MAYLKFSSPQIFTGTEMLTDNSVIITNENGRIEEIVAKENAGEEVQYFEEILSPGLINSHCHLELSHMKGIIGEGSGLIDFLLSVITKRGFETDIILQAIADGEAEMVKNGIVAVGDICNTAHTILQKEKGNLHYYNFVETLGWNPAMAQVSLDRAEAVLEEMKKVKGEKSKVKSQKSKLADAGEWVSLSPHAPYTVSQPLWQLMQPYFNDKTITIHNEETLAENELFINGTGDFLRLYKTLGMDNGHFIPSGKSSLQTYYPYLENARNVLLVHNTFTSQEDLDYLQGRRQKAEGGRAEAESLKLKAESNTATHNSLSTNNYQLSTSSTNYFCLCPNANLYIEKSLPPVDLLMRNNCNIVVGTDSLTSNHALDIVSELKTLHNHQPKIEKAELLKWATINGAKALQMDSFLGSFEKGKTPGIVEIKGDFSTVRKVISCK